MVLSEPDGFLVAQARMVEVRRIHDLMLIINFEVEICREWPHGSGQLLDRVSHIVTKYTSLS